MGGIPGKLYLFATGRSDGATRRLDGDREQTLRSRRGRTQFGPTSILLGWDTAAAPTLPRIVIGPNDPRDEGGPREEGREALCKAGGTPALLPRRDTLPRIVIGPNDPRDEGSPRKEGREALSKVGGTRYSCAFVPCKGRIK